MKESLRAFLKGCRRIRAQAPNVRVHEVNVHLSCFGQNQHQGAPYEEAYRQYERAVQQALGQTGHFELVIDDTAPRHMISPAAVETMLKHLASSK